MAYKSPVSNVYYQSTSGGRPRTPNKTELGEISDALNKFSATMGKYAKVAKTEDQKNAQAVFDKLKMEGITNPDDIQKMIDNNDPKVEGLQKYWAKAVIDTNFAVTHALDDKDRITENIYKTLGDTSITGLTFADINLDEEFKKVTRDFTDKSTSYVRAYTEAFDKVKIEFQDKKLVADAERFNFEKLSAAHTQMTHLWDNTKPEDRWDAIQLWYKDKTAKSSVGNKNNKGFLQPEVANRLILNMLEERVKTTNNAAELMSIKTMLETARGKAPAYLKDLKHQTQSARIWKAIETKAKSMKSNANVKKMFFEGKGGQDIYNDENISLEKKKLAQYDILKDITKLVELEAYKYNNNNPNLPKFDKKTRVDTYINSIMNGNAIVFYPWKEELDKGLGIINNYNSFQADKIEDFMIGYNRFKQLKRIGTVNNPNPEADYLTGREELFYEGVLALEKGGMEINQAVTQMWGLVNNAKHVKSFDNYDDEIQNEIKDKFDKFGFWSDDAETHEQVQEALRIYRIMKLTGEMSHEEAKNKAVDMIGKSYIEVDGLLWNRRSLPQGNPALSDDLTSKSKYLAKTLADDKYDKASQYDKENLVLVPWEGNQYVIVERNTKLPAIFEDGKVYAYSYAEVFGKGDNSLSKIIAEDNTVKLQKDRNNNILKILDGEKVEDLESYMWLKNDLKVIDTNDFNKDWSNK